MKLLAVLLATLLSACAATVVPVADAHTAVDPKRAEYASEAIYVASESSVRVVVECLEGGLLVLGSGTTTSADTILTAKHVVEGCDLHGGALQYSVTTKDGQEYLAILDEKLAAYDVATLITLEESPFKVIPRIATELPLVGEQVCWVGGDYDPDANGLRKCGEYSGLSWREYLLISGKGAPGNSGSGIFNAQGELIGVLNIGDMSPEHDFLVGFTSFVIWQHLV